ncbi:MAG: NADH:ubiquinone reductase (Na(+)-transporting) subunit E [Planctomycetes bacterium]|nr:NADH:ubiquinone reductase (Na(+)-transporting) subunit E [Planctomycetota bacterium]
MPPDIHPVMILIASILTSNILLVNFLGLCSFVACSRQLPTALGLGAAVTFVLTLTTGLNWIVYHKLLKAGALSWLLGAETAGRIDLEFLYFILSIAVIAGFVQLIEMIIDRFSPKLYYALGIFLPLITVNCAILGASLFMINRKYDFLQSVAYGFGSGLGWWLVILTMSGIRQRLRFANVPKPLQGVGITLLISGLMAMAFAGFTGMVKVQ